MTTPADTPTLEQVFVTEDGAKLDIAVGAPRLPREDRLAAVVNVKAANPVAGKIAAEIAAAMRAEALSAPPVDVVRVRTRKRAATLGPSLLANRVVIVSVSESNARRLVEIVDAVRSAKPLGVQLVWDGTHARERIFDVLERARSTPNMCPVFLAKTEEPCFLLRAHAERRKETGRC